MDTRSLLFGWLVVWMATAAIIVIVRQRSRIPGAGLVVAYLVSLGLLHWVGAAALLLPQADTTNIETVLEGFRLSAIGVLGFAIGSLILMPLMAAPSKSLPAVTIAPTYRSSAGAYLAIGCVCYVLLLTVLANVPSLTAVVSTGQFLVVAALCLSCWRAWNERSTSFWWWIAASLVLPFVSTIAQGMMGYGATAAIIVFAFAGSFYRPRWRMALLGMVLCYGGLVLYNGYMRDRNEIRALVWGGASFSERVSSVIETVNTLSPLDLSDNATLKRIDARLNQNYLVGASVEYIQATGSFANGSTVKEALLALIPRALWPSKPVRAGSGNIVSQYTGIEFMQGTSVGVGHVMEFYINFGVVGVFLGFVLFGLAVSAVDVRARLWLEEGNWERFIMWFLPGICLLNVGGSFAEIGGSVPASIVIAWLANLIVRWNLRPSREAKDAGGMLPADARFSSH